MSWTVERKVTVGGFAAVLVIVFGGITGWYNVKNMAANAASDVVKIKEKLKDHNGVHEQLDVEIRELSTGQAVLKEQVNGLKDDLQNLKEEQRRDFDRVLRALEDRPFSENPSEHR